MGEAEDCAASDDRPTTFLVTRPIVVLHSVFFLLSEVKRLTGMNFITNALDEVLVGDFAILIPVEPIKDDLFLLLSHRETPVCQEKDKFSLINVRVIVFIKVLERFSHSAPLLANLGNQSS